NMCSCTKLYCKKGFFSTTVHSLVLHDDLTNKKHGYAPCFYYYRLYIQVPADCEKAGDNSKECSYKTYGPSNSEEMACVVTKEVKTEDTHQSWTKEIRHHQEEELCKEPCE